MRFPKPVLIKPLAKKKAIAINHGISLANAEKAAENGNKPVVMDTPRPIIATAPNGNGCVNNSTKSSIIRPRDKGFYKKRNGNLKRKLVVRLVKKDRSLRLQVWVVRKILKLSCIFIILT